MPHATVTPEVETVLRASRVEGNKLFLTSQRLDRGLYAAVNKVLVNAGGKWSRSEQAHIFEVGRDPMVVLGLSAGEVVRDAKKDNQAFYTSAELARRVVQLASVEGKDVLEPSCGEGALMKACLDAGADSVTGYELDARAVAVCQAIKGVQVWARDFLLVTPPEQGVFHRVVMNPPFAKSQDIKHVAHAWTFLKPGGRLVAIMWPNTDRPKFKALLNAPDVEVHEVIPVDEGAFSESGTETATIILVLDKKS